MAITGNLIDEYKNLISGTFLTADDVLSSSGFTDAGTYTYEYYNTYYDYYDPDNPSNWRRYIPMDAGTYITLTDYDEIADYQGAMFIVNSGCTGLYIAFVTNVSNAAFVAVSGNNVSYEMYLLMNRTFAVGTSSFRIPSGLIGTSFSFHSTSTVNVTGYYLSGTRTIILVRLG